ncbi:MAG: STAS domain-containing protein, partial [Crocinitomicaceae bacterium]|nr:STAS domain-containing protein [Crocinitomicaceae bacterium]
LNQISHFNCTEIQVSGTALTEPEFEILTDAVQELIDTDKPNIILNLKEIKVLNSLGINTLIKIFTRSRNHGGDLIIVNISDKISQVLLLTKLNTVLNIAPSVQEAVNNFNS